MGSLTKEYLESLKPAYKRNDWPVPKWIMFCEQMIDLGFIVHLYRSKTTVSKYIYLKEKGKKEKIKIRFSNHKANYHQEVEKEDCDYYVGIGHKGVVRTEELIEILKRRKNATLEKRN